MTTFGVTHRTTYTYRSPVTRSYGQATLLPRSLPGQRCLTATLSVAPVPADERERRDFFGNRVSSFTVTTPHTVLDITCESVVEVDSARGAVADAPTLRWEAARDAFGDAIGDEGVEARHFLLDSPMVVTDERVRDYARRSFPADRDVIECVADLVSRIHRDFEFRTGVTTVESTVDDLFATGAGVCQDFAHLAVGCLRATGLPARYVSGYLETQTSDGAPKLSGVDVSHAWAAVLVPERGWVELDPTNDQFIDSRYVTIGWGRDYGDVTPLKGVIHTDGGTAELTVTVDVVRRDGDDG